jgi:hypothetical protein
LLSSVPSDALSQIGATKFDKALFFISYLYSLVCMRLFISCSMEYTIRRNGS